MIVENLIVNGIQEMAGLEVNTHKASHINYIK
ncbi:MAG: hypothetical protein BWY74_00105 [Firmicutes bacterium ADurb.Bin419]|nr:MAG: hypothetical protein BWY74_00105 [Firmicutes bacterium ADurb.Bin419]